MKIIDVRTKEEYECGHIKDAELFDIMNMMYGKFPEISKDEDILLYCESGSRATIARSMMEQAGFKNVSNGGGLADMINNGYKC
jgi:rhodanese-related sulfurtransferase